MTLTPDEIARRGFTPSADGYHQGEVREFLARIAAQNRAIAASLPDGGNQVAELMLAVSNHESRLHQLEARLHAALEQLEDTTRALQNTQDRASQQLAAARKVTSDQRTMLDRLTPTASAAAAQAAAAARQSVAAAEPAPVAKAAPAAEATPPAAAAPGPAETASPTAPLSKPPVDRRPDRPTMAPPTPQPAQTAATPIATRPIATTPATTAPAATTPTTTPPAPTPPRTSSPDEPNRAAAHMTAPAASNAPRTAGGSLPDGVVGQRVLRSSPTTSPEAATSPRAAADEAASVAPPAVPTEELPQPSVAVTSISKPGVAPEPEPVLASPEQVLADFDRKPLIADNANDLLDGVLDDVMGTITERPDA